MVISDHFLWLILPFSDIYAYRNMEGGALNSFTAVMYWQFRSICRGGGNVIGDFVV